MFTSPIKVTYLSVDHATITRRFKSLAKASAFAREWVGDHPDIGTSYAVSGDGVGTITCEGCTLAELFPPPVEPAPED